MARRQTPWHRKQTGWWMVEFNGQQTKLVRGPKDEAHRRLAEEELVDLRKLTRAAPQAVTARTVDIIEAYLAWSRGHNAPDTHRVRLYYCQLFAEHCGRVPARELKPYHVTKWLTAMMSPERVAEQARQRADDIAAGRVERRKAGRPPKVWGETTCANARTTAFRVFSWAKDEGLIADNPLAAMKRPKPPPRQRAMADAEFETLLEHAGGPFADLLTALRETGARPKEVRDLTWDQVHADRWVMVKNKTVHKTGKARVVMLGPDMQAMMARLRGNGHTHVFLNTEGEPWTMNAVRLQMTRLRRKLDLAPDLCAYLRRHGSGTRAVLNGVNPAVVAELMGHSSLDMVSKAYVHPADEHAHLKAALEKVNPSGPAAAAPGPVRKRAKPVRQAEGKGPAA